LKILTPCLQCKIGYADEIPLSELTDDHTYEVRCSNGHKSRIWLQNNKFELLFDSACLAINDGYNFEAVASLAAAFERFLEYYIKIILIKNNIPSKEIHESWKQVSRQSERQLGGFIFLYLMENNKSLQLIQNWHEFRNKVLHRGFIPSIEDVKLQGETLFRIIKDNLNYLKENYNEYINKEIREKALNKSVDTTLHIPTMICPIIAIDEGPKSFEQCLIEINKLKLRAYDK